MNSTLTLAIAAVGLARREVFVLLTVACLVLLWRQAAWLFDLRPTDISSISLALRILFVVAWVGYGVLYFRQAVSPEISPDGMAYHLGLVNLWNHTHGLSRTVSIFGALPDGVEMLFLFAFTIGRHSAATLVHFSFLLLLPWLMVLYGCRFGWARGSAVLAALLVLASPLIGMDGTSAYNDVALGAFVFGAVYLLDLWRQARDSASFLAAAFLAGFTFAIKYTAGFFAVFMAVAIFRELWRTPRRTPRAALIAIAAMAVGPAPYLVRNAIWFQDPIAFFGNKIFPNPWFHVSFEAGITKSMSHVGGMTWADVPRELTIGGDKTQESFGPAFALLPLGLLGLAWPRSRFLVLAAAFAACSFAANKSGRFLIPAAPLLAMSAAFAIGRLPGSSIVAGLIALSHLIVSWPSINNEFRISSGWRIVHHIPWTAALRIQPEADYLKDTDPYVAARLIEAHVPEGQPVLVFWDTVAQSYTTRPILFGWASAFTEVMTDWIEQAANGPGEGRTWTVALPQSKVLGLRIVQTGPRAENAIWSINEVRLWNGQTPVTRKPSWKLRAEPNRWDLPFALDGSELTRWRSWEDLRPGMSIEMRFDPAETIDRIDLIGNDGQRNVEMKAFILNTAGEWSAAGQSSWRLSRFPDLRKEATQELKAHGVRYLEISRQGWNEGYFRGDFNAWGLRLVAATPRSLLLEVD
ncbi:MAG TPA: glycosyltransferase family 39 protein [Bryobacteraceae bacterium]